MTKEECVACIEIQKNGVEALSNASLDVITNDFLLVDFPAIIEDGTKGWPKPKFDITALSEVCFIRFLHREPTLISHNKGVAERSCREGLWTPLEWFNCPFKASNPIVFDFF